MKEIHNMDNVVIFCVVSSFEETQKPTKRQRNPIICQYVVYLP